MDVGRRLAPNQVRVECQSSQANREGVAPNPLGVSRGLACLSAWVIPYQLCPGSIGPRPVPDRLGAWVFAGFMGTELSIEGIRGRAKNGVVG